MVRLLPADEAYFTLLERLAGHLTAALAGAQDAFTDPASAAEILVAVRAEEHAADALAREILTRLDRTFVTPFDRDDIHALALHLDMVVDLAEDAAESLVTLHVKQPDASAAELAGVLLRAGQALAQAVGALRRPGELLAAAQQVRRIEEEGDAVYTRVMTTLFADPPDPMDVLRRKTLYDTLEEALDECERVAAVLEGVALQYR